MSLVSLRAYYCNMNPSRRPLARGVAGRGVERRAEHRAERRAEHRAPSQYRSRARACRAPRPAGVPARTRRLLINIRQRFNIYSKRFIDCRVTFETLELHFKRFQYKNNMIHDFKIIFVYFFLSSQISNFILHHIYIQFVKTNSEVCAAGARGPRRRRRVPSVTLRINEH